MALYQYQTLDVSKNEIRILHIHPGSRDDAIRISIEHIPFNPSEDDAPFRVSQRRLKEIQKDLPWGWRVYSTIEGRPIFSYDTENEPHFTSWQSPIPTSDEAHSKEVDYSRTRTFVGAFEAVSYTWGSAQPLSNVTVVDAQSPCMHIGTCSVGPNLLELLKHLRRPANTRALWIDAICINQEDPIEKGEQVRRMYDIFKFASRTVIWLGKASDDSMEALRALEHMGKQLEFTINNYFIPAPDASEKNWWTPKHSIPLSPSAWTAIANLMERPYFERLWVLQEAQVASQHSIMQCGEEEILWYYARRAFLRCRQELMILPHFYSLPAESKRDLVDNVSRSSLAMDIEFLFEVASLRKCADPRDKVFAIFGLLPLKMTQHIRPSYELTVQDIYIQAFLATVYYTHRMFLLNCTNQRGHRGDHPSWAPDLRVSGYELHTVTAGSCSSGISAVYLSYQPPNRLQVRGFSQGQVQAVSPSITTHARDDYTAVLELVSLYLPHISKEQCLDWYVWVTTQGDINNRWHGHSMKPSLQETKYILRQIWAGEDPEVARGYRQWYMRQLNDQQPGRFFVTDRGQLGCGPPTVSPGDKICVLSGYDKPVLVRPANYTDHSTCYHYMGPLYVHGLMEGQAFLGSLPPPWKLIVNMDEIGSSFSFLNCETDEITQQDPRLDVLPQEWQEVEGDADSRGTFYTQHYKNHITGEIINSDPRLFPESLEARGIHLETITLV
jgi:hypothetical protein